MTSDADVHRAATEVTKAILADPYDRSEDIVREMAPDIADEVFALLRETSGLTWSDSPVPGESGRHYATDELIRWTLDPGQETFAMLPVGKPRPATVPQAKRAALAVLEAVNSWRRSASAPLPDACVVTERPGSAAERAWVTRDERVDLFRERVQGIWSMVFFRDLRGLHGMAGADELEQAWRAVEESEIEPFVISLQDVEDGKEGLPDIIVPYLDLAFAARVTYGTIPGSLPEVMLAALRARLVPLYLEDDYPLVPLHVATWGSSQG